MCGIAGVYHGHGETELAQMTLRILHRGPDGRGTARLPKGMLAHTRLAIIDPAQGKQPFFLGNSCISFNGEIYNFRDLAQTYLQGIVLKTHSDTEVLLQLFLKLGPAMVPKLNGMFAFAIYHGDELFVARDPLGIKPLYHTSIQGKWWFASEQRALSVLGGHMEEFPPGTWYSSKEGWKRYYTVKDHILPFSGSRDQAKEMILAVSRKACHQRLVSDVPLGVSLSGGLDSSIIAKLAIEENPGLFTFCVGVEGSPDIMAARMMARTIGSRHRERIYSLAEMLTVLPEVIKHLEAFDPALVRSALANWFLAELASQDVKVMLTGEGADELYAGYDYLATFQSTDSLQNELIAITSSLHNSNLQRADRMSMAWGLEARVPFLDVNSVSMALGLAPEWKLHRRNQPKELLRETFEPYLPHEICHRPKLKFSAGAGSSTFLHKHAESIITDRDFQQEKKRMHTSWGFDLSNKEELFYLRLLKDHMAEEDMIHLQARSASL